MCRTESTESHSSPTDGTHNLQFTPTHIPNTLQDENIPRFKFSALAKNSNTGKIINQVIKTFKNP
jgi:hypothetical protein